MPIIPDGWGWPWPGSIASKAVSETPASDQFNVEAASIPGAHRYRPADEQLILEAMPVEHVQRGDPATGWKLLASLPGLEVGVWEHTPGVSTDTEEEEVFIVLSGRATVSVLDERGVAQQRYDFGPGDVGVLEQGASTRWAIHETLRKVFVSPTG